MTETDSLAGALRRLAAQLAALPGPSSPWLARVFPGPAPPADPPAVAEQLERLLLSASSRGLLPSPNDTVDDLPTPDLLFALLPHLLACAYAAASADPSHPSAPALLLAAADKHTAFLDLARALQLAPAPITPPRSGEDPQPPPPSPAAVRQAKIDRFKAARALAEQMDALLPEARRDHDSPAARTLTLLAVRAAADDSVDAVTALRHEAQLRRHAEERRAAGVDPAEEAAAARRDALREALAKPGAMPPNFVIKSAREQARQGVFKPDHRLPTYTVEQWGEVEARRMMLEAARQQEAQAEQIAQQAQRAHDRPFEQEEMDEDAADAETYRQRGWDDWKDDHNKGSGNTLR